MATAPLSDEAVELLQCVGERDAVPHYLADSSHPVLDALRTELGEEGLERLALDVNQFMQRGYPFSQSYFGAALIAVFNRYTESVDVMARCFENYMDPQKASHLARALYDEVIPRMIRERRGYRDFIERENDFERLGSEEKWYAFGL